jgi:hypothetical protein
MPELRLGNPARRAGATPYEEARDFPLPTLDIQVLQ